MPPFVFKTSVQAVQLTGIRAASLAELHAGMESVDGSSIYHHTYRFLRTIHFLPDAPRSDFAWWIGQNLKEEAVSERMEALDLRGFRTIRELRDSLLGILRDARERGEGWERRVPAGLEFHFCRSSSIVLPTGHVAGNLEQFRQGLGGVDVGSIFYHTIESPLHYEDELELQNDFSIWLSGIPGCREIAASIDRLDFYSRDLETLRAKLLDITGRDFLGAALRRVMGRQAPSEVSAVVRGLFRKMRGGRPGE